ncbi:RNA polymerase sigma factor [Catenuloplanes atrovinosus]|uniref:RNA polymerase sigma-70 factor (ECF subfamily) n=1 Tax=Catenuloplanes atrovinosus TaxID=137266 RepID=A0AAE3YQW5_9ACTN|nr:RNA polymerase sigma factor [Catenuloplanes atrovinosus]MDR7278333.1 RNA polymerase sigma-70 factor (ECF subfamily) [Catenuloplanes atrovinosus]
MQQPEDLDVALRAAQSGDEEAFRLLYRLQQPALLRYLRVLVGDDAEDVASEAWLQIARDLGGFAGDWDGFRGWTATIARHRAMDSLRAQRRRPVSALPVEALPEPRLTTGEDAADRAMELLGTEAAVAMIASLPRDQAEAVMLRVVIGLDAKATGRILGKRAGAVRTAAYRGLRTLAERLTPPPRPAPRVTHSATPALREVR